MKKLITRFRLWRYRRLYRQLFWLYAQKSDNAATAGFQAAEAFGWITGEKNIQTFSVIRKYIFSVMTSLMALSLVR